MTTSPTSDSSLLPTTSPDALPTVASAVPAGTTTPGSAVLVVGICWSAGIALGVQAGLTGLVLGLGALVVSAAALLARAGPARLLSLGLLALLFGQLRLVLIHDPLSPDVLASYAGPVVVTGRVVDAPIPRGGRVEAVIEVDSVAASPSSDPPVTLEEPRPRVLVRAPTLRVSYGDRIATRGRLARPRSRPGWPLADLLARRGIFWVLDTGGARVVEPGTVSLSQLLAALRARFEANTRATLPEPQASLVAGIVFGARVGLPPDLKAAMSATGTTHLTAVSGANVAMVAGAMSLLAGRFLGRAPAAGVAIVVVWLYTLLVGAPPSALRAAMMASVALLAHGLGRQPDAIVGLVLAVALLLGWDPGLAGDLGFQLSVAATAGLVLLSPVLERWLAWLPRAIRGEVAIAVAAQIAALPILAGAFQRISLISLPANVLAAPTIPPLMALGAALAAFGFLPGFDVLLGWAAWLVSSALLGLIQWCAGLPGAVIAVGRAPDWLPWAWYGAVACWAAAGSADAQALGLRPGILRGCALLFPVALTGWLLVEWAGVGRSTAVEVALLDVEPAAAFVRTPSGRTALVMVGRPSAGVASSVGGQLDLTESGVDVEIDPDGLRAGVDLLSLTPAASSSADDGDRAAREDVGTDVGTDADAGDDSVGGDTATPLVPGSRVDLGDGVSVEVVDVRLMGQATVLDLAILVDDVAVLLPGPGAPSLRWTDLAPDAVTIGRLPSSAVAWARVMPPRRWLLLVGEPALERARGESGVPLLTGREHGQVELSFGGGAVAVRTERCVGGEGCEIDVPGAARASLARTSLGP